MCCQAGRPWVTNGITLSILNHSSIEKSKEQWFSGERSKLGRKRPRRNAGAAFRISLDEQLLVACSFCEEHLSITGVIAGTVAVALSLGLLR